MFSSRVLLEVVDPGVSSGRSAALRGKKNKTSFLATPFDVQTNMKDVSIGAGGGRTADRRTNGSDLHEVAPPGSQSASPEAEGGRSSSGEGEQEAAAVGSVRCRRFLNTKENREELKPTH